MIFDADILGYFMNGGDNKEKGNLGYAPFAANPAAKAPTPNVWIWSLAMSSFSKQKDAAWLFMQWAASVEHDLFGARKMDFVNPVRASVWKDERVPRPHRRSPIRAISSSTTSRPPGAKIYFTAQPLFFDLTDRMGGLAAEDGGQGGAASTKASTSSPTASTASSSRPVSADVPSRVVP